MFRVWAVLLSLGAMAASQPTFAQEPDIDFFALGAIESTRSDQRWCEEHYPSFTEKNALIISRSIYAGVTGESFVRAHLEGEPMQRLLDILPKMRAEKWAEYAKMPPQFLARMCTSFEAHLGPDKMRR